MYFISNMKKLKHNYTKKCLKRSRQVYVLQDEKQRFFHSLIAFDLSVRHSSVLCKCCISKSLLTFFMYFKYAVLLQGSLQIPPAWENASQCVFPTRKIRVQGPAENVLISVGRIVNTKVLGWSPLPQNTMTTTTTTTTTSTSWQGCVLQPSYELAFYSHASPDSYMQLINKMQKCSLFKGNVLIYTHFK